MEKRPSNFMFRLMALEFMIRDLFKPRKVIVQEIGIKPGFTVLDFGCGPGGYVVPVAELVGNKGMVYALDAYPLAVKMVDSLISKKHLTNVKTILSDAGTGLPDKSVDVVLLFDILHDLSAPNTVLAEIRRVLKPGGILSVTDHHLDESDITFTVTKSGLFRVSGKGPYTHSFK